MGEAGNQGLTVIPFEFVKLGAVDGAGDHVAHVKLFAQVGADDAVDFFGVVQRSPGLADFHVGGLATVQVGDAAPCDFEGVGIVFGIMVGNTGDFTVYVCATEVFGGYYFTGGGFFQWRAGQEDGALVADDDGFVRHGGHVGATGGAQAHDDGNLGDVVGGHAGLVVEDAAEVVAVREDFVLPWQVGAARVYEVDAGQAVLQGDFLGPQVFFHRQRVVAATFNGGVVGDDHAFGAGDTAHAGDHASCRDFFAIDVVGGELADFQEGGAVVQEAVDALAGEQLATVGVALLVVGTAALLDGGNFVPQVGYGLGHGFLVGLELFGPRIDFALEYGHFPCLLIRGHPGVTGVPPGKRYEHVHVRLTAAIHGRRHSREEHPPRPRRTEGVIFRKSM